MRDYVVTTLTYLASPYSHPELDVRAERYWLACKKAAELMLQGEAVFAPIAHSHPISLHMPEGKAVDHELWLAQDIPILRRCDVLKVLLLPGWDQSQGVREEIEVAVACRIPVEYIKP